MVSHKIKQFADKYKSFKAQRWIFFSVILSFIAVTLAIIFDLIAGYTLLQTLLKYFKDFVLVIFTIAASVMSIVVDTDHEIQDKKRFHYGVISGLSMLFGIAIYSNIFDKALGVNLARIFFPIFLLTLFINVNIGASLENNDN